MSYAEVMTILILFHQSHYRNFKWFYREYVSKVLCEAFPGLVSYNRFVELQKSVLIPLCYLLQALKGEETGIYFIDSTPLKACHIKREKQNKVPINAGIGINKGKVISGNIGSKDQMDYTVIGDTVNLGARLCSFAGPLKIIISQSVKDEIGDLYKTRKLDAIKVKGKRKPVEIFKVLT